MKIVIIPSWYNSEVNVSRGSFIRAQAVGLSKRGHEVTIIVLDRDSKKLPLSVKQTYQDGMIHFRISLPSPLHRLIGFYFPFVLAIVVKRLLKNIQPDLVHAHAVRPAGIITNKALRNSTIPWCITEHSGPLKDFWLTFHGKDSIYRAYVNSHKLFAVSRTLRTEMLKYFGNGVSKTTVIYNGIDTTKFKPISNPNGAGRLLFVGALDYNKNLELLLRAIQLLPDSTKWTLTVVGSGHRRKYLISLANELCINNRITWVNAVHPDNMPKVYNSHDLLIIPSIHETFSLVCAESFACMRPVIATRCGGPEEIVTDFTGALVPVNNDFELSNAINNAIKNFQRFDLNSLLVRVRTNFSMEALLDNLEREYIELVN